jgi:acetolactate synthase-1/2/3 large subunit
MDSVKRDRTLPNHAEVIAQTLVASGVENVFGLPGGEITAFIDACRRKGLRFLLTGHESSAAIMAQVLGQITGIPGVCAATLGPGATNLVTGVANAFLDRAPLLAFTAQIPSTESRTTTHQRLDLNALFSPVTKRSVTIGTTDTISLVQESLDLTVAPRPGPVHLCLPSDVAIKACASTTTAAKKNTKVDDHISGELASIAARITASQRPLIIVGLGTPLAGAPALRAFVDKLGAPFLLTPKAKGILPEDHALFLGVASGMAVDEDVVETVRMADLVIGVGFDPVECDKTWFAKVDSVSLDSVSMNEGDYQPLESLGEISTLLRQLSTQLRESRPWPEGILTARRKAVARTARLPTSRVSPLALIEALRTVFPRDGIVTCDVGSHKLLVGQFWRTYEPGTFFMSNGLSGMGFGIPAAIGAQLAYPNRPVMAIVGDGGMLMMVHDLVLIRELGLPIIIVCLTDGSLSLIRVSQERRGFLPYGVDFLPPDFVAMAEAFGIHSEKAQTIKDAKVRLQQALEQRRPMLLDVPIDFREYYELV